MAIKEMKRIELLAMLNDSKAIVDLIQQCGCVEITDYNEEENYFYKLSTSASVSQFEKFHGIVDQAKDVLNSYVPAKGGLLSSFAPRPDMTVTEFYKKAQESDAILSKCYSINALYREIQEARVEIVRAETAIDQVKPWAALDIPSSFTGTATTAAFVGSFGVPMDREQILTALAEKVPEIGCEVEVISSSDNQTCIVALCHRDDAKEFDTALRSIGFVTPSDPTKHEPQVRIKRLETDIEACNKKIAENEEKIKTYAEFRDDINFLEDYFVLRTDKYKALDKISMSDNVFVLTGYIPAEDVDFMTKKLTELFDVAISVTDVDMDSDEVPVFIENGALGGTMESITEMYSTPSHADVDPNTVMTVFYFLLFGLMLGDAGYGLLMVIACLFVKFKFKLEKQKAKTVNYGLLCGVGTTVWGILLNSWFGDLPHYIANGFAAGDKLSFIEAKHLYWFSPLEHTTRFLLLAFFVGILHLGLGVCVNIWKGFKHGSKFDSIVENVPQLLILVGVIPLIKTQIGGTALAENPPTKFLDDFINSISGPLYGCLAAGAALIVLGPAIIALKDRKSFGKVLGGVGGGLYGLYNAASGYLGDILSYARLLALGLCTGVIASVINQLAALLGNPVLFVLVAIFGHLVNFGINIIGAYVHTNRLQYVEFFGKFFEGGGKSFAPLNVKSKSFKFKEET